MANEIQKRERMHPELWNEESGMVRFAPNGMSVKTTRAQAMKILIPMFSTFPNIEMNEMGIDNYITLLQDIPPEKLQQAVYKVLMSCSFLPTIAQIRDAYESIRGYGDPYMDEESDEVEQHASIGQFAEKK